MKPEMSALTNSMSQLFRLVPSDYPWLILLTLASLIVADVPIMRMIVRPTHQVKVGRGYLIGIEKSTRFCGHGRPKRTVRVNLRLCSWQLSLRINCDSCKKA